ncbi:hypothetical protein [Thiomonas sp. FB-Cd]|uniref:hypothetical protein n=1 Tax=Thiomonas sp. FB-Cd TaxID=1158292 RepID=UPI0005716896|nr:hypothetical protein [Thiomonas sp. FB-Cd]
MLLLTNLLQNGQLLMQFLLTRLRSIALGGQPALLPAEVVKTQAVGFVQAATLRLQALHPLLDLLELLAKAR